MMMMIYESRPDPGLGKRVYADTQCLVAAVCCRHSHGRIDQHRAGVLSLDGSTEHSVLTPLTIPASGLRNTHGIAPSLCYLSLVHPLPLRAD